MQAEELRCARELVGRGVSRGGLPGEREKGAHTTHCDVVLGEIDGRSTRDDDQSLLQGLQRRLAVLVFERQQHLSPEVLVRGPDLMNLSRTTTGRREGQLSIDRTCTREVTDIRGRVCEKTGQEAVRGAGLRSSRRVGGREGLQVEDRKGGLSLADEAAKPDFSTEQRRSRNARAAHLDKALWCVWRKYRAGSLEKVASGGRSRSVHQARRFDEERRERSVGRDLTEPDVARVSRDVLLRDREGKVAEGVGAYVVQLGLTSSRREERAGRRRLTCCGERSWLLGKVADERENGGQGRCTRVAG